MVAAVVCAIKDEIADERARRKEIDLIVKRGFK